MSINALPIIIPKKQVISICQRHHIARLALFGSVLRDDFAADSDVDFLVEFQPESLIGLFELMEVKQALSELIGREADVRTPEDLSLSFRAEILNSAVVQYGQS